MNFLQSKYFLKGLPAMLVLLCALTLCGQDKSAPSPAAGGFDSVADKALIAMKNRAKELNVKGVAVVAWSAGDPVESWLSKMMGVEHLTSAPSANSPAGENNLAIAYTKAAEMAVYLKDSGSHTPKLKGENGWSGGVMSKAKNGYVFAAFSGGVSDDDVKVSRAGLEILSAGL